MTEERFITEGTTPHPPLTASNQTYGPGNTRPAWIDEMPDPDKEAARFTGSTA
jgi:hypothetical protein